MRQRLGIAASLMRSPRLLVLDEPANGLDPAGIRDLRTLIAQLPEQGVTVLYSSHLLAEVEEVCNRVAIVDRGRIAFEGRLDELRASFGSSYVLEAADESRALAAAAALGIGARLDRGAIRLDASEELADAQSRGRRDPPLRAPGAVARGALLPADGGGQRRTSAGLLAAVPYAVAFVLALALKRHAGIPPDIPLASQATRTAVVLPLALLAFATFFGAPVISSLVAGDIVAAEDANNTLKTILTRSTGRGTIYAAKALAAATYGVALVAVLFVAAVVGVTLAWGLHGVVLLDGRHVGGAHALGLVALAYAAYLLPLAVLVSVAFFLSTTTRNSAAAIVGTVIFALAFQGLAALPGLGGAKPYLLPAQFDAWESLFGQPGASIGRTAWVCALYAIVPLLAGWAVFARRDVAGA